MSEEKIVSSLEEAIKKSKTSVTVSRDEKMVWIAGALSDLPEYVLDSMRNVKQFGYEIINAWEDVVPFTYPLFDQYNPLFK